MRPWTFEGRTAADGTHRLGVHVEAMGPPRAPTLRDTCKATSDDEGLASCTFTVVTGGS